MKQIQNKKHFKGFTLVELIIVITILAILATIAFISFQGYTKNARDGNRLSVINNLSKGLDIYKVQTGKYPQPDGQILTGTINNQDLIYKGEIQDTLSRLLKLNKTPKDPVTQTNYVYGVTQDLKEYQIASILEGDITSFITPTYADSFNSKVEGSYKGYLRYSSGGTEEWLANIPSLLYNYSGSVISTGVDLLNQTGTYYIINNGVNLPYAPAGIEKNNKKLTEIIKDKTKNNNAKIITIKKIDINKFIEDGTIPSYLGTTSSGELIGSFGKTTTEELKQHITGTSSSVIQGSSSVVSNYFSGTGTTGDPYRLNGVSVGATTTIATSCQYYNTGATMTNTGLTRGSGTCGNGSQGCLKSGVYLIDPDGSGGSNAFQAYCEMTTDGGGWTLVAESKQSSGSPSSGTSQGTLNLDEVNISTTAKLSDTTVNLIGTNKTYLLKCQRGSSSTPLTVNKILRFTTTRDWNTASRIQSNIIIGSTLSNVSFIMGISDTISGTFWQSGAQTAIDIGNYSSSNAGWAFFHQDDVGPYCGEAHNSGINALKVYIK